MGWVEEQIQALTALGVSLPDAQRSVSWLLANLPAGENPDVWIPSAEMLITDLDSGAVEDARIAWYVDAPDEFKRLLDAAEMEEVVDRGLEIALRRLGVTNG